MVEAISNGLSKCTAHSALGGAKVSPFTKGKSVAPAERYCSIFPQIEDHLALFCGFSVT